MKKVMIFGMIAGLVPLSLTACGSLFGGSRSVAPQARVVAEVADLAEVADTLYEPRRNPATTAAGSTIYPLPATPLKPESERLPPPVYAVSGVKGQPISEADPHEVVDIVMLLPAGTTFSRGILEGEDISDWFRNLPPGLEALAHGVKRGAASIKVYISGIPSITGRSEIQAAIPAQYLSSNQNLSFKSPTESESYEAWAASQTQGETTGTAQ